MLQTTDSTAFNQLKWTTTNYDALGRPLTLIRTDGNRTEHRYGVWQDADVGLVAYHDVIDANRHRTQWMLDALGRQVKVNEISGECSQGYWPEFSCGNNQTPWAVYAKTLYSYDQLDRLLEVRDAKQNSTTIQYDSLGRKIEMNDPAMGRWFYDYTTSGNLANQIDANGQQTTFSYDPLDRLISKAATQRNTWLVAESPNTELFHDTFDVKDTLNWVWSTHQTVPVELSSQYLLYHQLHRAAAGRYWAALLPRPLLRSTIWPLHQPR